MALTIDNILTSRVRVLLRDIDDGGIQWLDPELLEWINEACAEVARIRPEASSQTVDVALTEGARQSMPAGATLLLEGICNVALPRGGELRVIRRVDREDLDKENLDWMVQEKRLWSSATCQVKRTLERSTFTPHMMGTLTQACAL